MKKTVTIRLPEKLYEELKVIAKSELRTISSLIELLITKGMEDKK